MWRNTINVCIQQKVKRDLPAAVQNGNVKEVLQSRTLILQRVPEPRKLQVHKLDRQILTAGVVERQSCNS